MAAILRGALGDQQVAKWIPWIVGAGFLMYMMGFVDSSVHGAALGETSGTLNYVHEFFHHARHVALMCH